MNLNKSTRYALHSMMELALADGEAVTVGDVAARYDIPESALAKEITVQDIIDVFEPPAPADTCLLRDETGAECPEAQPECRLRSLFDEVEDTVRSTLRSVTLATLAR